MRCSASRMKGELPPTKDHLRGGLPRLVRTLLRMGDKFEIVYVFSGVATSRRREG